MKKYDALLIGGQYHLTALKIKFKVPYLNMPERPDLSPYDTRKADFPMTINCNILQYAKQGTTTKGIVIYEYIGKE